MPLTLEDRLDITELVGRYDQAIDFRDAAGYADTFIEDGVFQIIGQPEIKGREKLMRMIERLGPQGSRHWVNNMVIDGDGDSARMTCYPMVLAGLRDHQHGLLRELAGEGRWQVEVRPRRRLHARPAPEPTAATS